MQIKTPLEGARVRVRDYKNEDLPFVTGLWFDPENGRYMSDPAADRVDERYRRSCAEMEDNAGGFYFVIELCGTGERIGTCCAFPQDEEGAFDETHGCYDIGYCIHKSRWRQGFGTEVVNLLADWVREQGGTAVTAEAAKENRASCALLEKCGFAVLKEASFKKYHMGIVFSSLIYTKKL